MALTRHPSIDLGAAPAARRAAVLLAGLLLALVVAFAGSRWPDDQNPHDALKLVGIVLVVAGILGRVWCTLYIGGRTGTTLADQGPYSVTRHPAHVFLIIAAVGAGLQLGSIVLALVVGAIAAFAIRLVVIDEESRLVVELGEPYRHYMKRVPRLLPRPWLWHSAERLEAEPTLVGRILINASSLLLVLPAVQFVAMLHKSGLIRVLIRLP